VRERERERERETRIPRYASTDALSRGAALLCAQRHGTGTHLRPGPGNNGKRKKRKEEKEERNEEERERGQEDEEEAAGRWGGGRGGERVRRSVLGAPRGGEVSSRCSSRFLEGSAH